VACSLSRTLALSDSQLLAVEYRTLFVTTQTGKIERENDPDGSPGPRLWFAGCSFNNLVGMRSDVTEHIADEITALATSEPPFASPGVAPVHIDRYIELLSSEECTIEQTLGVIYELPHNLDYQPDVTLIHSESEEGKGLHDSLLTEGLPASLEELGFRSVSELWSPWCVALHDGEIASVALSARLSEGGAELGLATAQAYRGRGYAAAATSGWSRLPSLESRALFYSAHQTNRSSRRVVERLGLRLIEASLRLGS
jgi:GNAT acetyltransferase-like protein